MSSTPHPPEVEIAEHPGPETLERDGIGEEDHPIPRWFNLTFAACIVFAVVYFPYYTFISGWSSEGQYAQEVAVAEAATAEFRESLPAANPYLGDVAAAAEGKEVFTAICSACHKPDGSGLVGPSLVDPYWKYGDTDAEIYQSVSEGRPAGMPPWGAQLGSEKIWKVLAYLETLPKSEAPGMGAPEAQP